MINTKNSLLVNRQGKSEKEKKLDLIMARLHKLENRRAEIEKEIRKIINAQKLNNLRKKFLNK